jgi:predicted Rossmann fold flavoprotein
MKRDYHTIIIGAGASGLMLASLLSPKEDILLIDSNSNIGAKIAISGGGKCNLTNESVEASNYVGEAWFTQSVLSRFDQEAVLAWFAQRGVTPHIRKGGQYFCQKSADEVLAVFRRELREVDFAMQTLVSSVTKVDTQFTVETDKGSFFAEHLVVASGGLSFPKIGASGIGYRIAEGFGHSVATTAPALVGFTLQPEQFFFKALSGASLEVQITTEEKSFRGDLLFAHKGISGPAVLNASLYWKKGQIEINFLPDFNWGLLQGKKQLSTILPLPKKVAKAFLDHLKLSDKSAEKLTDSEKVYLKTLQHYSFAPAGTFGYSKAEVTRGGVSSSEIDPYSMMSLKEPGLYFIGEVLDITGELGGYNLQWAFSSAYCCASAINGGDVAYCRTSQIPSYD